MYWKRRILLASVIAVAFMFMVACAAEPGPAGPVGPAGPPGPLGPVGPAGEDATANLEYVGSEKCGDCHEEEYGRFMLSGHPYKLTKIEDGEPPIFPYDAITGGLSDPPEGYTWDDISYVIGGYNWKARFMDQDGYIITDEPGLCPICNMELTPLKSSGAVTAGGSSGERKIKYQIRGIMRNLPATGHPMEMLQAAVASLGMFYGDQGVLTEEEFAAQKAKLLA